MMHEFIIKTIIDNGGVIYAGYVREWVLNGEPSNTGWNDIDCSFKNIDNGKRVQIILNEHLGDNAPFIDCKINFYEIVFNDFWCNCWKFDGKIKPVAPALDRIEKTKYQTESKIAQCIHPFRYIMRNPSRVVKFIQRGWTVLNTEEIPICVKSMQKYMPTK